MRGTDRFLEQPPLPLTFSCCTRVPSPPELRGIVQTGTEGHLSGCSLPGSVGTLLSTKRPNPNCLKRLRKATTSLSLRSGMTSPSQVGLRHRQRVASPALHSPAPALELLHKATSKAAQFRLFFCLFCFPLAVKNSVQIHLI